MDFIAGHLPEIDHPPGDHPDHLGTGQTARRRRGRWDAASASSGKLRPKLVTPCARRRRRRTSRLRLRHRQHRLRRCHRPPSPGLPSPRARQAPTGADARERVLGGRRRWNPGSLERLLASPVVVDPHDPAVAHPEEHEDLTVEKRDLPKARPGDSDHDALPGGVAARGARRRYRGSSKEASIRSRTAPRPLQTSSGRTPWWTTSASSPVAIASRSRRRLAWK